MSDIRSRNKIIYLLTLFCLLLSSCSSDDNEETDPYKSLNLKSGYINIYYNGIETELKEITSFHYLNSEGDTLGIYYTGYIDKTFSIVNNAVSIYISKKSKLDRVTFNYSPPGTNYATQYGNYSDKYNDDLTYFEYRLYIKGNILEGEFNGKLFNPLETIDIDSCKFYIER
ncbi:hypothetical protein [Dysgonomonas sp. GY617]|uniref:hypothetical protein n=1 Tax=Dysgonomonas sp. GY617 TaxID=2780420 RepID=UPI0018841E5C|nr:hypothetical protein [Dysgonomonas sp. GY617]MBF0576740.1 hypothetical protein [Dysgonomonas sp. GY617]